MELNNKALNKEAKKKHIRPKLKIMRRCFGLDNFPKISIIMAAIIAPMDWAVPNAPSDAKNFIIKMAGAVTIKPWANPFNKAIWSILFQRL